MRVGRSRCKEWLRFVASTRPAGLVWLVMVEQDLQPGHVPAGLARLLDASANRAREGVRLAEDVARFVLEREELAARLREVRHEITRALAPLGLTLLEARDTAQDVGLQPGGAARAAGQLQAALQAGCGRAQEALRVLEEGCAAHGLAAAASMAQLRYRMYELEQEVLLRGPRPRVVPPAPRIYLIWDLDACRGDPVQVLEGALEGGVGWVQLRAKGRPAREVLDLAREAQRRTRPRAVAFLVNDHVDVAALSWSDGVHLGSDDLRPREARRLLGAEAIVGATAHTRAELEALALEPVDYVGYGPIGPTRTKRGALPPRGVEAFASLPAAWKLRAVPVGGVDRDLAAALVAAGASQVAVGAAIVSAPDPAQAAGEIRAAMEEARGGAPGGASPAP